MAPFCRIKLLLTGNCGVGKTCVMERFLHGVFTHRYSTSVVDYDQRTVQIGDKLVQLDIWDTAGILTFERIYKVYYKKTDGIVLMYDVTDLESYKQMISRLSDIRKCTDVDTIIVGNKDDYPLAKVVDTSVVELLAEEKGMEFIEVSAKTGSNVTKAFEILVRKVLEKKYPTEFQSELMNQTEFLSFVTPKTPDSSGTEENATDEDIIRLSKSDMPEKTKGCQC